MNLSNPANLRMSEISLWLWVPQCNLLFLLHIDKRRNNIKILFSRKIMLNCFQILPAMSYILENMEKSAIIVYQTSISTNFNIRIERDNS